MDFEPSPQDHHRQNAILGRHKAIDELVQGREFANQLHSLLSKSSSQNDMSSDVVWAEDLVTKIMNSFSNTLLMLNQKNEPAAAAHHDDDEVLDVISQVQPSSSRVDSPCLEGRKSEDSQESCRSTTVISTTPSIRNSKDRRGCYKRRKNSHTWKRETPNLIDDGFAWRKYGQKDILNAKYPRSYFRCTHKYDQGCLATKQVQKIEEEPPMFRTTYHGDHTCGSLLKAPELVLDCTSPSQDSSILLSFNKTNLSLASKQAPHPFFSPFQSVKQELKDDHLPIITSHNYNQTSSSDYIVSPDDHHLTAYDQSPLESDHIDHEDLMSGVIMDPFKEDLELDFC